MEQKKRIGIWIRVSTDFQVENDSPEVHEQRARHYAAARGWEVIEVYRLEAVSGKTILELPETKKMLRDIQTGRITALVFSKLARLARNTKELLEFSELFRKANADMVSLAESIDTSSPAGRLFYTIVAAMTQWEREEIAERVAASVPVRAKMGKPLGGAAPYGYQWTDKAPGKSRELVIDHKEAPIRKLMYELFAQHKRKGHVAKLLNQMGHRTRNGSEFSDTTIGRLLHDSTAKGIRLANYTKSLGDNKKWVVKPESEWVRITCPAIVPVELWDICDKILSEQEEKNKRATKPVTHLFSGILFCDCGGKMYYHPDGQKYKCTKCRKTKIGTDDIEEIYFSQLEVFLLTDSHFDNFLSKAKQEISEKEKLLQTQIKERKRIQTEMDKKMELYLAGQIPKDRFGSYYNPLDVQLRQIENTIPHIEAEIDFLKIEHLNGDEVKHEARTMYERWATLSQSDKRAFVERVTSRLTIAGDEISIRFRYHPSYFLNPENDQRNFTHALAFWKTSVSFRNPLSIVVSEHLGDHIKKKRFSLALLQKDVAKILNVSEDTVTYWENGRSVPQIQFYPKIIEFLGYTPFSVDTSTLAGRMKGYRMENGVSQEDLGKLVGVNESTVFNWEKGYHKPFASKLKLLEKIIK